MDQMKKLVLIGLLLMGCGDGPPPPMSPNIVLLYTDDQGWADLGVQGATDIATPNIDQLASEGIRFTNFYAASNVCTASRAGLLTGSYPPRVDLNTVFLTPEPTGLNPEEVTLADMLKARGYATSAIGKWHLGELAPAWPLANGFDHFFGLPYSNDIFPQPARPFTLGWPPLPLYEDSVVIDNGNGNPFGVDQHPLTSRFTDRAIEFIEENRDRPFFLYLPYSQPHYPNWVGEDWMGTSGRGDYGDSVQEIDWSVGQIVQALEDNGLTDNTIVLFTSDNGPWDITCEPGLFGLDGDGSCGSALPLFGWKQQTYEGGHRVPFVARWPGHIPAGSVSDELATQMDFLPTVAEVVGVDISDNPPIDGHSITDLLEDPENAASPYDYYFYWDFSSFGNHDGGLDAVRDAEGWRLQIRDQDGNEVHELYYLPHDIGTENNIADANPDKVMELQEAAAAHEADIEANVRPRFDSRL